MRVSRCCRRPCADRPPQFNGMGPVPVVVAAGPTIVALLQELLARQQAIAARTDQLSVVRITHTTAQISRICGSREEGYLFSQTGQTSVVGNSNPTAQISRICKSREEGYLFSQTGQTSVVGNSNPTAQISRSRRPECPTSARVEKSSIA